MYLVHMGLFGLRKIALRNLRYGALSGENVDNCNKVYERIGQITAYCRYLAFSP
jgi:hypothetical protein